jgi:uncharacterized membrane protein
MHMTESTKRFLFLALFAVVFFQWGAHVSQAFVNYPAWGFISAGSFIRYHHVMNIGALRVLLGSRVIELALAIVVICFKPKPIRRWILMIAVAFALCTLASTILIQIPIQRQLGSIGNTPELLGRLRKTDLLRQVLELGEVVLYVWMMWVLIRPRKVSAGSK